MTTLRTKRLGPADLNAARDLFTMMAFEFAEEAEPLSDDYLAGLLDRDSFWAIAAFLGGDIVGGVTAHTLPMTRSTLSELFIYDLAVRRDQRRQGVGSRLIHELRAAAALEGISEVFVPADNDDQHALDFYRAQGAAASPVTFFSFTSRAGLEPEDPGTRRATPSGSNPEECRPGT